MDKLTPLDCDVLKKRHQHRKTAGRVGEMGKTQQDS
jgi:hypothetical protein